MAGAGPRVPPFVFTAGILNDMHLALALTVYIFTTTDCPISNRYAPEIQRLAASYGDQAEFVLVYPVASDTKDVISDHHRKFGYSLEYVRDDGQKLAKRIGVTVTPEVAVMKGSTLLYRGRIDDRFVSLGVERPKATTHDLEDALSAAIAGKPIATTETRAVGCILADLVR